MLTIITLAERQDVFHPPHDYKVKTEGGLFRKLDCM